MIVLYNIK